MPEHQFWEAAMSSFALTARAGISSSALDATYVLTNSTGETSAQFGDGVHGAAVPLGSTIHPAGGGASGNAAAVTAQPLEDQPLRLGYGEAGYGGEGGHFSGILMQQGRVQVDADHNEPIEADRSADEVSIAFEHGQMRWPFVTGDLWSSTEKPPTIDGAADTGQTDLRSMSSPLDSMSEMGETESLRLQMAMDRLSKMMSTLSNLLQKIETTHAAIAQNVK